MNKVLKGFKRQVAFICDCCSECNSMTNSKDGVSIWVSDKEEAEHIKEMLAYYGLNTEIVYLRAEDESFDEDYDECCGEFIVNVLFADADANTVKHVDELGPIPDCVEYCY